MARAVAQHRVPAGVARQRRQIGVVGVALAHEGQAGFAVQPFSRLVGQEDAAVAPRHVADPVAGQTVVVFHDGRVLQAHAAAQIPIAPAR
ncbi:hypothetical protein G6F62_014899 [Rhizopus arrhizus]|nr:hypothetical protein G6F62_014899 [Rhizopus arrhizus]